LSHRGTTDIFPRESQDEVALMLNIKIKLLWWHTGSRSNQFGFMVSGMDSNGAKDHMLLELLADEFHVPDIQLPCRVCGQVGLKSVMSSAGVADQAASNPSSANGLAWCPTCSLVQIADAQPMASGIAAMHGPDQSESVRTLVAELCDERQLGPDSLALEIAGSEYLRVYQNLGVPVLRIDLSSNSAPKVDTSSDLPALRGPLDQELALELVRNNQRADVVHLGPMFSQIDDLNGIVSSLSTILKPEGSIVVQVPYLKSLVQHADSGITALNRSCFSLTALTQLFGQHGLEIIDVEHQPLAGGSFTVTVARFGTKSATVSVREMMDDESDWVRDARFLRAFGEAISRPSNDRRAA